MTVANWITLARIFFIPVFCVLIYLYTQDRDIFRYYALAFYAVASVSDFVDGYVARHYNQGSKLGARLDPMADKLLVNLGFVFIAANPEFAVAMPKWFPVWTVARDIAIIFGVYAVHMKYGQVKVRPKLGGKINTVLAMATMVAFLLQSPFAIWIMWLACAASVYSVLDYALEGVRQSRMRKGNAHV